MKILRPAIVALFLLFGYSSYSQTEAYKLYNISSDEGLPSDNIYYVFQDSHRFLWMATFDGLLRWDGHEYKKYTSSEEKENSLTDNIVYNIFEDRSGNLWVGTKSGLNIYNRDKDEFIPCKISDQYDKLPVNAIVEDKSGKLWLGTSMGLCQYNEDRKFRWFYNNASDGNSLSGNAIFSIAVDKENNLWLGTFNGGVNKLSADRSTFNKFVNKRNDTSTICSNKIKSILVDHKNDVWIGSYDNGITVLSSKGNVLKHYKVTSKSQRESETIVSCIYEDKEKTIWAGVERQPLQYLDKNSNTFRPFNNTTFKKPNIKCQSVSSLCEDSFGNLWFATHNAGLFYTNADKNLFSHYFKEDRIFEGLQDNTVTSFLETESGQIWIGTYGGGLSYLDKTKKKIKTFTISEGLSSNSICDIIEDNQGKLWLGTWGGGIIYFDPMSGKAKNHVNIPSKDNSLIYNNIKTILLDDSVLWIGTHGEGLALLNLKSNKFIHRNNNTSVPFDLGEPAWINHLFLDSRKRIWISTYSGLYLYDRKKLLHFAHSTEKTTISSNSVNMVSEDQKGRIWIISESGGLDRFIENSKSFTRYSRSNMPKTIKAIVADDKGFLWLSSNEGLIKFDPDRKEAKIYTVGDGLQSNFFTHKAVLRSKTGMLYFGGNNGFNAFHPENLKDEISETNVFFTSLHIYDKLQEPVGDGSPLKKVLCATDTLILSHNQAFFSIGFNAIDLNGSAKTEFQYKMQGLHNNWVKVGTERKASFTNLDPGTYQLKVRIFPLKGIKNNTESRLTLVVLPPWWKTVWFRALGFLLAASSISATFYMRIRSIKQHNKELEAQVEKRTHELVEANDALMDKNEEIRSQNEKLHLSNEEILRQSEKILIQQDQIVDQNHRLEQNIQELTRLNHTKDRFFSILAHDLKNPVAALAGIAEALRFSLDSLSRKEIGENINSIYRSSQSVYNLLINLLNWGKIHSDNIDQFPSDFSIHKLVQKNIELLSQQLNAKNISIQSRVCPSHMVFADLNMIDAVMRNLLSNCLKFTYRGGNITIQSKESDNGVIISISDDGIGMTADQLENLFKVEKNQISSGTAGETGTGLGLIISREFILTNKGTIDVESVEEQGTTFLITLPKAEQKYEQTESGRDPSHEIVVSGKIEAKNDLQSFIPDNLVYDEPNFPLEKLIRIKGKRILIIDDNREIRAYLKLILSQTFEIFEAENGKKGLEIAVEVQPTAIICDVIMPVMDGLEFCKTAKKSKHTSHIPIILLTSQLGEQSQTLGYGAGAEVFLNKPVKKELLFQVIFNFLENQSNLRQALMNSSSFVPKDNCLNKLDEEFLTHLVEITEAHLSDPNFDHKLICDHLAMSRTAVYTKLKTLTGFGVHEFIRSVRLKKSIPLLLEGKLSVSQISYEVGFNSHSYFNRCFIKQYGMAPKEYVKNRKKKAV